MAFVFLIVTMFMALRALLAYRAQRLALSGSGPQGGLFETAGECIALLTFGLATMVLGSAAGNSAWLQMSLIAGVILAISAPIVALLSNLLPRSLASSDPEAVPTGASRQAIMLTGALLKPFQALQKVGFWLAASGGNAAPPLTLAEAAGSLLHRREPEEAAISERQVVRRLLAFTETLVRDVMVPLIRIYAVRDGAPVAEAINIVRGQAFSRLPVFHERMFNIVGIIHAFDLLAQESQDRPVGEIMRPPLYVPETRRARDLLSSMQKLGINMAVVVDEHGGAVGIVTVEDLVEEIVGEIEDEYDVKEVLCQQLSNSLFRIEASMEVARLNERLGWELPSGDYETIGGLIMTKLGRIPKKGEMLDLGQLALEVADADTRTIHQVLVRVRG